MSLLSIIFILEYYQNHSPSTWFWSANSWTSIWTLDTNRVSLCLMIRPSLKLYYSIIVHRLNGLLQAGQYHFLHPQGTSGSDSASSASWESTTEFIMDEASTMLECEPIASPWARLHGDVWGSMTALIQVFTILSVMMNLARTRSWWEREERNTQILARLEVAVSSVGWLAWIYTGQLVADLLKKEARWGV